MPKDDLGKWDKHIPPNAHSEWHPADKETSRWWLVSCVLYWGVIAAVIAAVGHLMGWW